MGKCVAQTIAIVKLPNKNWLTAKSKEQMRQGCLVGWLDYISS